MTSGVGTCSVVPSFFGHTAVDDEDEDADNSEGDLHADAVGDAGVDANSVDSGETALPNPSRVVTGAPGVLAGGVHG